MNKLYHVTPMELVPTIIREGLRVGVPCASEDKFYTRINTEIYMTNDVKLLFDLDSMGDFVTSKLFGVFEVDVEDLELEVDTNYTLYDYDGNETIDSKYAFAFTHSGDIPNSRINYVGQLSKFL